MDENNQPTPVPQPQPAPQPSSAPQSQPVPQPQPQWAAQQPAMGAQPTPQPPVIESASATTSPDNHSSALPYVIVAAVLALLVTLALALSNLVVAIADGANMLSSDHGSNAYEDYGDLLDDLDGMGDDKGRSVNLTQDNVFDFDLTAADYSVNDYVFASDYSGSQQTVSTYVKSLTKLDSDATSELSSHLRAAAAATDADTRKLELEQAATMCQGTAESIEALALPDASAITGDAADDILEDLTAGRDATQERWEKLGRLASMLLSPDGHTSDELSDLDNDAGNVTDAALDLTHALSDSASHK